MDLKRFEDYKQEVIRVYKKKKNEGKLPPYLLRHTPANLKKECINVFSERYSDKDSHTFTSLFGKGNNAGEYLKIVESSLPKIFKPLDNFLKEKTIDTHDRNIELLAWLIDFEPRPHRYVDIYDLVKSEQDSSATTVATVDPKEESETERLRESNTVVEPDKKEIIDKESPLHHHESGDKGLKEPKIRIEPGEKDVNKDPNGHQEDSDDESSSEFINTEIVAGESEKTDNPLKINDENFGVPRKFNKTVVAFFAALVVLSGTFIFYKQEPQCMYWTKDHYQSVTCDQKVDGAAIIALDNFRLTGLRKITNKALITRNDIGKVYYSKVNGIVEFYTSGGENPEDNHKRLLPMTEYMYNKYVLNK